MWHNAAIFARKPLHLSDNFLPDVVEVEELPSLLNVRKFTPFTWINAPWSSCICVAA
jgi:hypothetical protein